jgi:hypothetical protein
LNWALDKIPGLICINSSTFFFHCLAPIGVCQSITVGTRNRGEYLEVQGGTGLLEPGLVARAYAVGVDNQWDGDGARRKGGPLLDIARRGWDEAGAARWSAWGRLGGAPGVDVHHRRFGERLGAVTIGEPAGEAAESGTAAGAVGRGGGATREPPRRSWTTQEGPPRAPLPAPSWRAGAQEGIPWVPLWWSWMA